MIIHVAAAYIAASFDACGRISVAVEDSVLYVTTDIETRNVYVVKQLSLLYGGSVSEIPSEGLHTWRAKGRKALTAVLDMSGYVQYMKDSTILALKIIDKEVDIKERLEAALELCEISGCTSDTIDEIRRNMEDMYG